MPQIITGWFNPNPRHGPRYLRQPVWQSLFCLDAKSMAYTTADVTKLVTDFHQFKATGAPGLGQLREQFSVAKRENEDLKYAKAYGVARTIVEMEEVELAHLCRKFNTTPPRENQNLWGVAVRILFQMKQGKKNVPDPSAFKYGRAFRAAAKLGFVEDDFIEQMTAYTFTYVQDGKEKKARRMIALIYQDTKDNSEDFDEEYAKQEAIAARRWLVTQGDYGAFNGPVTEQAPEDGQLVSVVAQYHEMSGKWAVRHVTQTDDMKVWASISKEVLKEFKQWRASKLEDREREEFAKRAPSDLNQLNDALDQHRDDVEKRERKDDARKRVVEAAKRRMDENLSDAA